MLRRVKASQEVRRWAVVSGSSHIFDKICQELLQGEGNRFPGTGKGESEHRPNKAARQSESRNQLANSLALISALVDVVVSSESTKSGDTIQNSLVRKLTIPYCVPRSIRSCLNSQQGWKWLLIQFTQIAENNPTVRFEYCVAFRHRYFVSQSWEFSLTFGIKVSEH